LAQLKQLVGDASHLQDKPSEWHSRLAEVLSRLAAERKHRWVVSRLAVVPVHSHEGRKWVSAKTQDVYFSRGTSGYNLPEGIRITVVDPEAEANPSRQTLFKIVGVKSIDGLQICSHIQRMHGDSSFNPKERSREQLISHARFVFEQAFSPPKGSELWFATEHDDRLQGSRLYIDEDTVTSLSATTFF
jgi:hypothetical protein